MTRCRKGFALLAVLWIVLGASLLVVAAMLDGHEAVDSARNRINGTRAYWSAHGCMAAARAAIDSALAAAELNESVQEAWRDLGKIIPSSSRMGGSRCTLSLQAAGSLLDVNEATQEQLSRLFHALGLGDADALTDALLDWRDVDNDERPFGAEASRYIAAGRPAPRNGPLASMRELARVRGFDNPGAYDTVLSVEPGRISIATAPLAVLALVPGFTDELLAKIAEQRASARQVSNLLTIAATLSPGARDSLMRHYDEAIRLTSVDPDAWIVTTHAEAGLPVVSVTVEARVVRVGWRAAVVRYRYWQ